MLINYAEKLNSNFNELLETSMDTRLYRKSVNQFVGSMLILLIIGIALIEANVHIEHIDIGNIWVISVAIASAISSYIHKYVYSYLLDSRGAGLFSENRCDYVSMVNVPNVRIMLVSFILVFVAIIGFMITI